VYWVADTCSVHSAVSGDSGLGSVHACFWVGNVILDFA